jgi:hypothetical protein
MPAGDVPDDEYCARVLGAICTVAADSGVLAIAYDQLPGAVETIIAPLFGLRPGQADRQAMTAIAGLNARRGDRWCANQQAARRLTADPELTALAAQWVAPALARLAAGA